MNESSAKVDLFNNYCFLMMNHDHHDVNLGLLT